MAKTIVGLFDNTSEAQQVVRELIDSGFRREDVSIVANSSGNDKDSGKNAGNDNDSGKDAGDVATGVGTGAVAGGLVGGGVGLVLSLIGAVAIPVVGPIVAAGPIAAILTGAGVGAAAGGLIGGLTAAGVPHEDAQYYAEGVNRGGTLVMVAAAEEKAQQAYDIMISHGAVDIDERGTQYRNEGWTGYDPNAQPYNAEQIAAQRTNKPATTARAAAPNTAATTNQARNTNQGEGTLPVVQEELQVGKRQVQSGGARIYTHVTEQPVQEQVQLREERVDVNRRPVNRPVTEADMAAFKEGSIDVTTTAEQPVVSKQARVVEEVGINKKAQERTETIQDSVRRNDVQVEQMGGQSGTRSYNDYETDFRNHYQSTYGQQGGNTTFDQYSPVYRFGYDLASDPRNANADWNTTERAARSQWEARYPNNPWDQVKDSVRYAWERARGTGNNYNNASSTQPRM